MPLDRVPYKTWGLECSTEKADSVTGEEILQAVEACRKCYGEARAFLVLVRPGLSAGLQLPPGIRIVLQERQHCRPGTIQVYPVPE